MGVDEEGSRREIGGRLGKMMLGKRTNGVKLG